MIRLVRRALVWILDVEPRCDARSPEGWRCTKRAGHDERGFESHHPWQGPGYAWGGNYAEQLEDTFWKVEA